MSKVLLENSKAGLILVMGVKVSQISFIDEILIDQDKYGHHLVKNI